jgi:hypothetical protein
MVDEEPWAEAGRGVDLDPGQEAVQMGDEPANEAQSPVPEPMGTPVEPHGVQAGIAENDLERTADGRITIPRSLDVPSECFEHLILL